MEKVTLISQLEAECSPRQNFVGEKIVKMVNRKNDKRENSGIKVPKNRQKCPFYEPKRLQDCFHCRAFTPSKLQENNKNHAQLSLLV